MHYDWFSLNCGVNILRKFNFDYCLKNRKYNNKYRWANVETKKSYSPPCFRFFQHHLSCRVCVFKEVLLLLLWFFLFYCNFIYRIFCFCCKAIVGSVGRCKRLCVCVCAYLLFGVCRRLSNKLRKNERRKEHKTNKGNN